LIDEIVEADVFSPGCDRRRRTGVGWCSGFW
jgi:hypothetical protein